VQVPITDFQTAQSAITINDVFSIASMQVMVDIQHSSANDLLITLTGPTGNYILSMYNGGIYDNFENTIFDPAVVSYPCTGTAPAGAAIPGVYVNEATNQSALFRGVYRPQPGTTFPTSGSAIGTWTIQILDNSLNDQGVLRRWGLIFNRYGNYKDVRWGWDVNQNNKCGTTGSRYPAPFIDDWNLIPLTGFFPYRVHGYRPEAGQALALGLFQNSKTQSVTRFSFNAVLPNSVVLPPLVAEFTIPQSQSYITYQTALPSMLGDFKISAELYQRTDLFMTRNDNTIVASVPLTPGSLAYDNGTAAGSTNVPVNNCESVIYNIAQTQASPAWISGRGAEWSSSRRLRRLV